MTLDVEHKVHDEVSVKIVDLVLDKVRKLADKCTKSLISFTAWACLPRALRVLHPQQEPAYIATVDR